MATAALVFLVVGAADYLFDNRLGLGLEFEKGFSTIGKLVILMTGFMSLAPVLSTCVAPITAPFFQRIGSDPSLLAGLLLSSDAGGAALAKELALNADAGLYNGIMVGSMMGVTVSFTIPMVLASVKGTNRIYAIYGLVIGILSIPFGCVISGILAGFSLRMVLLNSMPVILFALVLFVLFLKWSSKLVPVFVVFAKIILSIALSGLIIAVFQTTTGTVILEGMTPLNEIYPVICNIGVFLAGILPLLALFRLICRPILNRMSQKLSISERAISCFLITLANSIPTFSELEEMDSKGCMMNVAFLVCGSFALGDYLAFTMQFCPQLSTALVFGKLAGAVLAAVIACVVMPLLAAKEKN